MSRPTSSPWFYVILICRLTESPVWIFSNNMLASFHYQILSINRRKNGCGIKKRYSRESVQRSAESGREIWYADDRARHLRTQSRNRENIDTTERSALDKDRETLKKREEMRIGSRRNDDAFAAMRDEIRREVRCVETSPSGMTIPLT